MASMVGEQPLFRLIIVRHGETTANAAGIIQGQSLDPSFRLTELGKSQAVVTGRALLGRSWWKVVSSDLPRTRETTDLLLGSSESSHTVQYSELVREARLGAREGQPLNMTEKQAIAAYTKEHGLSCHLPTKAETKGQVAARGVVFLKALIGEAEGEQWPAASAGPRDCLLVSHGGFIRTLLRDVIGVLEVDTIRNLSISTVEVLVPTRGARQLAARGPHGLGASFRVLATNDTRHLEKETLMSESSI